MAVSCNKLLQEQQCLMFAPNVWRHFCPCEAGFMQSRNTKANSPSAAEALVLQAATKWIKYSQGGSLCDKSYRANTRHWPFCAKNNKAHPHTTFPHCEHCYPANANETPPTTSIRGFRCLMSLHVCNKDAISYIIIIIITIFQARQNICIETVVDTRGQSTTFFARRTAGCLWHSNFPQMSLKRQLSV